MIPVAAFFEAARLATDVQRVMLLRCFRLAAGDAKAASEAYSMVAEKVAALMDSQTAILRAVARGHGPRVAARRGLTPYRKRVRANLARLSR